MSTKATPEENNTLMANDPLMDEFAQGQRSNYLKGVLALIGVALAVVLFFIGFVQMGTV